MKAINLNKKLLRVFFTFLILIFSSPYLANPSLANEASYLKGVVFLEDINGAVHTLSGIKMNREDCWNQWPDAPQTDSYMCKSGWFYNPYTSVETSSRDSGWFYMNTYGSNPPWVQACGIDDYGNSKCPTGRIYSINPDYPYQCRETTIQECDENGNCTLIPNCWNCNWCGATCGYEYIRLKAYFPPNYQLPSYLQQYSINPNGGRWTTEPKTPFANDCYEKATKTWTDLENIENRNPYEYYACKMDNIGNDNTVDRLDFVWTPNLKPDCTELSIEGAPSPGNEITIKVQLKKGTNNFSKVKFDYIREGLDYCVKNKWTEIGEAQANNNQAELKWIIPNNLSSGKYIVSSIVYDSAGDFCTGNPNGTCGLKNINTCEDCSNQLEIVIPTPTPTPTNTPTPTPTNTPTPTPTNTPTPTVTGEPSPTPTNTPTPTPTNTPIPTPEPEIISCQSLDYSSDSTDSGADNPYFDENISLNCVISSQTQASKMSFRYKVNDGSWKYDISDVAGDNIRTIDNNSDGVPEGFEGTTVYNFSNDSDVNPSNLTDITIQCQGCVDDEGIEVCTAWPCDNQPGATPSPTPTATPTPLEPQLSCNNPEQTSISVSAADNFTEIVVTAPQGYTNIALRVDGQESIDWLKEVGGNNPFQWTFEVPLVNVQNVVFLIDWENGSGAECGSWSSNSPTNTPTPGSPLTCNNPEQTSISVSAADNFTEIVVTAPQGYTNIALRVDGQESIDWLKEVGGNNPFQWTFEVPLVNVQNVVFLIDWENGSGAECGSWSSN